MLEKSSSKYGKEKGKWKQEEIGTHKKKKNDKMVNSNLTI